MFSFKQHGRRVALAFAVLTFGGLVPSAYAAGTDTNYGLDITNQASVNYSVSGVAQSAVLSSPTGIGLPQSTTFKVDKKLMFLTEEAGGTATTTGPGVNNVVTVFRVTNNTNGAEDFQLLACNPGDSACNIPPVNPPTIPIPTAAPTIFGRSDSINMSNLRARVSNAPCQTTTMAPPTYAGETQASISQLAEDACVYVFILADTPTTAQGAVDGSVATVLLAVRPTSGGTLEQQTNAPDVSGTVEAVFAEAGPTTGTSVNNNDKDGISFAYDQYVVGTLNVKKTYAVISDGFTTTPGAAKAIPGAVIEYTITVQNNGLDTTNASLTEVVPALTAYVTGSTTLNGTAVSDVAGAMPYIGGALINSPGKAAGVIVQGSTSAQQAIVKFRVSIIQ